MEAFSFFIEESVAQTFLRKEYRYRSFLSLSNDNSVDTLFTHFMGRRNRVTCDTGIYTVFIGYTTRCFLRSKI